MNLDPFRLISLTDEEILSARVAADRLRFEHGTNALHVLQEMTKRDQNAYQTQNLSAIGNGNGVRERHQLAKRLRAARMMYQWLATDRRQIAPQDNLFPDVTAKDLTSSAKATDDSAILRAHLLAAMVQAAVEARKAGNDPKGILAELKRLGTPEGLQELRHALTQVQKLGLTVEGTVWLDWMRGVSRTGKTRWTDTNTGEIRYQEIEPGTRQAAVQEQTGQQPGTVQPAAGGRQQPAASQPVSEHQAAKNLEDLGEHVAGMSLPELEAAQKKLADWLVEGEKLKANLIETVKTYAQKKVEHAAMPTQGERTPGVAYNVPTKSLRVDPTRFQYKLNVNKQGIVEEWKSVKKFNPEFAGVIAVWHDPADGQDYVINGHHRFELATRDGYPNLNVQYLDATDAKEARAKGALLNIAGGRGTAIDAAKFMRDKGIGPDELEAQGVNVKAKMTDDAVALTKLSEPLFERVARGLLEPTKAIAVAKHLADHDLQTKLFGLLDKRETEGKQIPLRNVEEMAREMAATPTTEKTESSLFGDITTTESLFEQRAELKANIRTELAREANTFAAVSSQKRADRLGEAGNVLDTEKNRQIAEQADQIRNTFDTLVNRKGQISDTINEAAAEYAKAKTKGERDAIRKRTYEAVRDAAVAEAGRQTVGAGEKPSAGVAETPPAGTSGAQASAPDQPGRGDAEQVGLKPGEPEPDKSPLHGHQAFNKPSPATPPSKIERMTGLTADERAIEDAAVHKVENEYPELRKAYLNPDRGNAALNADGSLRSVSINTDEWRDLFEGYTGTNAQAVHEPSSFANKQLLGEMLAEQKGKGNNRVAVYAGGGGSGKGTAIKDFFVETDYPIRVDQVTDNLKKANALFDRVKAEGFQPEYVFVDRPPVAAWSGVVGRAVRARENGKPARTVPLDVAMKANIEARRTAIEILKSRPDVMPKVIDNTTGEPGLRRLLEDRDEAIAFLEKRLKEDEAGIEEHKGRLRQELLDQHLAGKLPLDIARGLFGTALWDAHHARERVSGSAAVPGDHATGAEPAKPKDDRRSQSGRTGGMVGGREPTERTTTGGAKGASGKEGHALDEDGYVAQAMAGLKKTSRTAGGVVDTSASKGKAAQMAEGLTGEQAAEHATKNFESAIRSVWKDAQVGEGERRVYDSQGVLDLADYLNKKINAGIVKEGVSRRTENSTKFPYTDVGNLDLARHDFSVELSRRLNDPNADPIETAAWIEWRANLTDHFWADGVGKTSKALAAIPLMRAGLPLPEYRDNKEFFAAGGDHPVYDPNAGGEAYLDEHWEKFRDYYRTLFPSQSGPKKQTTETWEEQLPDSWRQTIQRTRVAANALGINDTSNWTDHDKLIRQVETEIAKRKDQNAKPIAEPAAKPKAAEPATASVDYDQHFVKLSKRGHGQAVKINGIPVVKLEPGKFRVKLGDAPPVTGTKEEIVAALKAHGAVKPPAGPAAEPKAEPNRDLYGGPIPKTFGKVHGEQQSAFDYNPELGGTSAWMDAAKDFAAEKGSKIEQQQADQSVKIGGQWYQAKFDDDKGWTFEQKPATAEQIAKAQEDWWDHDLTHAGRYDVAKAAGLKNPEAVAKTKWRHMLPENQQGVDYRRPGKFRPEDRAATSKEAITPQESREDRQASEKADKYKTIAEVESRLKKLQSDINFAHESGIPAQAIQHLYAENKALHAKRDAMLKGDGEDTGTEKPGDIVHHIKNEADGTEVFVSKHRNGYAVSLKDTDADETVPSIRIYPTKDAAIKHAETLRSKAQEPPKPAVPSVSKTESTVSKIETPEPSSPSASPDGSRHVALAEALHEKLAAGEQIDADALFSTADRIHGGTRAEGKYGQSEAYDALETAFNAHLRDRTNPGTASLAEAQQQARDVEEQLNKFPTQTNRTGKKVSFQQFSTPPHYSYAVAWLANLGDKDIVLEPSAGTGCLAVQAENAGAEVYCNELDPQRADYLRQLFGDDHVHVENAEHIAGILPGKGVPAPSVVVMNPPFSATAGRLGDKKELMTGAKHIEEALQILAPGGRLVSIVGRGMAMDSPTFRDWFRKIRKDYNIRANISVSGDEYKKYGTHFGTRLLVIDKSGPQTTIPVTGEATDIPDLMAKLEGVRNERQPAGERQPDRQPDQQPERHPMGEPTAGQPAGGTVASQGTPSDHGGQTVPAATGSVLPGERTEQPVATGAGRDASTRISPDGRSPDLRSEPPGGGPGGLQPEAGGKPDAGATPEAPAPVASPGPGRSGKRAKRDGGGADAGGQPAQQPERPVSQLRPAALVNIEPIAKPTMQARGAAGEFKQYEPSRIKIPGAKKAPAPLEESPAMASVFPPACSYRPMLSPDVIEGGRISESSLEAICYAGQAHNTMLPALPDEKPQRAGMCFGDGTGAGKGRQIAGTMLDNHNQGRKKAVWITKSADLIKRCREDFRDVGHDENLVFEFDKLRKEKIPPHGCVVMTYATMRQPPDPENPTAPTNLDVLKKWLGDDFDGVIAFDEAHMMANAAPSKEPGKMFTKTASKQALAGIDLQKAVPNARVLYPSATAATEVENLAAYDRLGLWGPGTEFTDKQEFFNEMHKGGTAALECVAQHLKATGRYVSRSLTFNDGTEKGTVTFDRVPHKLTEDQRKQWDEFSDAWQQVMQNIDAAIGDEAGGTGGGKAQRTAAMSKFWSAQQRFYNQTVSYMKIPSIIKAMEQDLKEGRSPVLQLTNTMDASTKREIARIKAEGGDLEELDVSPREILQQFLKKSFPVNKHQDVQDEDGNIRSEPVLDSNGKPVQDPRAVAMRDAMLMKIGQLGMHDTPLDMIRNHFEEQGHGVSEITGRAGRVEWVENAKGKKEKEFVKRGKSANNLDHKAFLDGKNKVLVFSGAGATGFDYHAGRKFTNHAQRSHYLLQVGWRADELMQALGRTHRTDQTSAPIYRLCELSDIPAERRFTTSAVRRLEQLGALTKGQRQATTTGLFKGTDNLESEHAKAALDRTLELVSEGKVEGLGFNTLVKEMGLPTDKNGNLHEVKMTRFLNRMLCLKHDTQNKLFTAFDTAFKDIMEQAELNGTLDKGMEDWKAEKIEPVEENIVYKDPQSGAQARHIKVKIHEKAPKMSFEESKAGKAPLKYVRNRQSGRIWAVYETTAKSEASSGRDIPRVVLRSPKMTKHLYDASDITVKDHPNYGVSAAYDELSEAEASKLWDEEYGSIPELVTHDEHFVSGALLPVWKKFEGKAPELYRLKLSDGRTVVARHVPAIQGTDGNSRDRILRNLGVGVKREHIDPAELHGALAKGSVKASLENGWRLAPKMVQGERNIEVIGNLQRRDYDLLERLGAKSVMIAYKTRMFIPVGEDGVNVLKKLAVLYPVVEREEMDD